VPATLDRLLRDVLAKAPEHRPADAPAMYDRLLPFVRDLPPLPGFLDPAHPARMYSQVAGRR
jgi:hypothetical protein